MPAHPLISKTSKVASERDRTGRELSDEQLVRACAAGDRSALEELFHRHGDRVFRVLGRAATVEGRDLEDLVQTTFLEVQRGASRYDGRALVGTWILGIAANVMRHYVRGEARRRSMLRAVATLSDGCEQRRPDQYALHRQLVARLEEGIAALPERLRIVFVLSDLEEVRGVEIARALGLAEGTVWRRVHDARKRLRAFIEGESGS